MGGQTVTILVQWAIIIGLAIFSVRALMRQHEWHVQWLKSDAEIGRWTTLYANQAAQIEDLTQANDRLRAQLCQIPLAPKPEKADDSVIRAKSPAQVRQITEQQWGVKPQDGEQSEQAS